jgi:hypothetical protein
MTAEVMRRHSGSMRRRPAATPTIRAGIHPKFCRVLDSVKAKFGVIFSTTGHSGEGEAENADREILKVYQDRGIVIVVIDREDLQRVAQGTNLISLLREKYEVVRLDLR